MGDLQSYETVRELGQGRTSIVLLTRHPRYGEVALKKLFPKMREVRTPDNRTVFERFQEELHVIAELRRYLPDRGLPADTIPEVYEYDFGPEPYLAMSVAGGQSVTRLLETQTDGLAEPTALAIMARFAAVLQVLHQDLRRTYDDIQFSNLFWQQHPKDPPGDGDLTVIDWNVVSPPLINLQEVPPDQQEHYEQQKQEFQQRVQRDVDLAAVFLFRLLTNRLVSTKGIALSDLNDLPRWSHFSRATRDLVAALLSPDPAQRPCHTAAQLWERLDELDKRWQESVIRAGRHIQRLDNLYVSLLANSSGTGWLEFALEVDAWLPVLRRVDLTDSDREKLQKLERVAAEHVPDPLTDMNKGRQFFIGADYKSALAAFRRLEHGGLGLRAVRWRLLAELAQLEFKERQQAGQLPPQVRILEAAVEALDQRDWTAASLQQRPGRSATLHRYFVAEAQLRLALEGNALDQARAVEVALEKLPDPVELGSGDTYRRALRRETGDIAEQLRAAEHAAERSRLRGKLIEELSTTWSRYAAAGWDNGQTFLRFASLLEQALAHLRGDPELVGFALDCTEQCVPAGQRHNALILLQLILNFADPPRDSRETVSAARQVAVQHYHELQFLEQLARCAASSKQQEDLLALLETQRLRSLRVPANQALLRQLLFQAWKEYDHDPALSRHLQRAWPQLPPGLFTLLSQANAELAAQKWFAASDHLERLDQLLPDTSTQASDGVVTYARELQKAALQRLAAEQSALAKLVADGETSVWLEKLRAWLQLEPGRRALLESAVSQWSRLLEEGQTSAAAAVRSVVQENASGIRLHHALAVAPEQEFSDNAVLEQDPNSTDSVLPADHIQVLESATDWFQAVEGATGELAGDLVPLTAKLSSLPQRIHPAAWRAVITATDTVLTRPPSAGTLAVVGLGRLLQNGPSEAQALSEKLYAQQIAEIKASSQANASAADSQVTSTRPDLQWLKEDANLWPAYESYVEATLLAQPSGLTAAEEWLRAAYQRLENSSEQVPPGLIAVSFAVERVLRPTKDTYDRLYARKTTMRHFARTLQDASLLPDFDAQCKGTLLKWLPVLLRNLNDVSREPFEPQELQFLRDILEGAGLIAEPEVEESLDNLEQAAANARKIIEDQASLNSLVAGLRANGLNYDMPSFQQAYRSFGDERFRESARLALESALHEHFNDLIPDLIALREISSNDSTSQWKLERRFNDFGQLAAEQLQELSQLASSSKGSQLFAWLATDTVKELDFAHIVQELQHLCNAATQERAAREKLKRQDEVSRLEERFRVALQRNEMDSRALQLLETLKQLNPNRKTEYDALFDRALEQQLTELADTGEAKT